MPKSVTALLHIRAISSLTPLYLLPHHCAACTPKSQEKKKKSQHCTYTFQAAGPPCGTVAHGLVICALPSVYGHRLCVGANSPWAPVRLWVGGYGVPHAEEMQGCRDKAAAEQDSTIRQGSRISPSTLGLLIK